MRRNYTRLCGAGLILFIAGFLLSCSEGDFTIFYQVINEKAIQDNDLDNTLSVQGMERVDLSAFTQPNRYYIAAGKIFTRTVTSDNWDSVSNQTDNDERLCNGLALYAGNLVGSFYSVDGKHYGLYTASIDAAFAASPNNIAWTPVADVDVAGKRIGSLKVVNGVLFISVRDGDEYSLVSFNGSYSIVQFNEPPLPATDKLPVPVRDVTFDGVNFWCITGSKIYQGSSLSVTQESAAGTPTVSGDERFEGIIHTSNGNIYLSTSRGIIWLYSGGTWTSRHFDYQASAAVEDDVWFTKFLEVHDTGGSPVDMVVVGTHGAGFFEINDGAADPLGSIERFANTSKKELYSGSAGGFFVADADNYAFFVLTLGSGLWRSRLKDGNWESWTWE